MKKRPVLHSTQASISSHLETTPVSRLGSPLVRDAFPSRSRPDPFEVRAYAETMAKALRTKPPRGAQLSLEELIYIGRQHMGVYLSRRQAQDALFSAYELGGEANLLNLGRWFVQNKRLLRRKAGAERAVAEARSALRSSESNERTFVVSAKPRGLQSQQGARLSSMPDLAPPTEMSRDRVLGQMDVCFRAITGSRKEETLPMFKAAQRKFLAASGIEGRRGSLKARQRLAERRKAERAMQLKTLADFTSSEQSPLQVVRVTQLLEDQWYMHPSRYRILRQLPPSKELRVARLLGEEGRGWC